MHNFCLLFLLFFIYSTFGWLIETLCCSIYYRKLVNRGFLIGPYCPIYGVAAICMILFLSKYKNDLAALFTMATIIGSIVEYIIGYIMEKAFHARWWDYSGRLFNINGRVYLVNSICFGFLGVILISYVNPIVNNSLIMIPNSIIYVVTIIGIVLLICDLVISTIITFKLKRTADMLKRDCSEEINNKVKEILSKKSFLFRRINLAFPNFNILPNKFKISRK